MTSCLALIFQEAARALSAVHQHSTDKNGNTQSRILPTLTQGSIITDTRRNTQFLVTEYGKANLKGLSTWQRAEAIIGIAHPDFQDQLIKEADKMGIWKRSNKIGNTDKKERFRS